LSGRAGFWAALAWPTFLVVGEWAHLARADMMMTALIFWAVLLADFSAAATGRRAAAALWGGASLLVSGAVMAKGLQALVFFVVPVAALWRARRGRWLPPAWFPLTTVAIVAACAVGWLLAAEAGAPGHLTSSGRALESTRSGSASTSISSS
jgi:4-amino-4-deoxy-L-arabinose transferase-like glycosyltransferase